MKNKVILITGGSSGMGKTMAKTFIEKNAHVVITGRNKERLFKAAEEIEGADALHTVQMDVRHIEDVERTVAETVETFGKIDCLVNNAAGNFFCPSEELTLNGWNTVVDIVLNGTWYTTQTLAKHWIKQKQGGAIINMVASSAWLGAPMNVHSASAKAGVLTMTKTLAVEWGFKYNIRVNAIAPGLIEQTGGIDHLFHDEKTLQQFMKSIPLKRLGQAEEISHLASYLFSEEGSYVNGECITIDGGQSLFTGNLSS